MIEFDNQDFFCALYINVPGASVDAMAELIAGAIGGRSKGRNAFDEFSYFDVKADKNTKPIDDDFTTWSIRIECFPIENTIDNSKTIYKEIIFTLIRTLRRAHHYMVVAVCAFEDEVRTATEWNWTEEHPIQPANL